MRIRVVAEYDTKLTRSQFKAALLRVAIDVQDPLKSELVYLATELADTQVQIPPQRH